MVRRRAGRARSLGEIVELLRSSIAPYSASADDPWYAAQHLQFLDVLRGRAVLASASEHLGDAGLTPRPVVPKLLVPILEGAALETEPGMRDRWARLLASASAGIAVSPAFPSILSQLTGHEARLLERISCSEAKSGRFQVRLDRIRAEIGFSVGEQDVMVDNLLRLRLLQIGGPIDAFGVENARHRPDEAVALTPLGVAFVRACRGPEPARATADDGR